MKFLAKIKNIQGKDITLEMADDINYQRVSKLSNGKHPSVEIELSDNRQISIDQRSKIYALIAEISASHARRRSEPEPATNRSAEYRAAFYGYGHV